jgi:alpha-beta hydrolase superfamily lysophospholipase
MAISNAILQGEQKYIDIRTPVLAIYALPHKPPPNMPSDSAVRAAFIARDSASTGLQAEAFERGVPSARVVRLPNADHFVFNSNEADVLREMRAFIDGLPPSKK